MRRRPTRTRMMDPNGKRAKLRCLAASFCGPACGFGSTASTMQVRGRARRGWVRWWVAGHVQGRARLMRRKRGISCGRY